MPGTARGPTFPRTPVTELQAQLDQHVARLRACRLCPHVQPPPVAQGPALSPVYLMGQAPGPVERDRGEPFAGAAGRTLFRWFASIGATEAAFRERVYMGAVIRCFPGKQGHRQGDRRPAPAEIDNCRGHWHAEFALLRPRLVLLVGRLAMTQFLSFRRLDEVVGRRFDLTHQGHAFAAVPLPHPSGLSRWFQTEPGRTLLREALQRIAAEPAWRGTFGT